MKTNILLMSLILLFCGCSENKSTLHIFSWADYIDPDVLIEFETKYNCNVCIDTFDSNEVMYSKLKAGAAGYDICIPSSYMVKQMIDENMIDKLEPEKLSNVYNNFDHTFDKQIIDPNFSYSVPYAVSYGGIMCLKDKVTTNTPSWNIFNDKKLNQKVSMLDDIREVIGVGLMYNGYSLNSENENEINIAAETIKTWRKNIRKFDAESYKSEVANKSLYLGHGYSTDSFQIILGDDENPGRDDIAFLLPQEGFSIAWDEMVILQKSKNKELAYNFINFIYENEVSLKNIIYNYTPIPNKNAIKQLTQEMKNIIILDEKTLKRGQVLRYFNDPKSIEMYNRAWDKIKAMK